MVKSKLRNQLLLEEDIRCLRRDSESLKMKLSEKNLELENLSSFKHEQELWSLSIAALFPDAPSVPLEFLQMIERQKQERETVIQEMNSMLEEKTMEAEAANAEKASVVFKLHESESKIQDLKNQLDVLEATLKSERSQRNALERVAVSLAQVLSSNEPSVHSMRTRLCLELLMPLCYRTYRIYKNS
jgi:hypothetical protein